MGWNYRLLAHEDKDDVYFQIHEVYYDKDDNAVACTERGATIGGSSIEDIEWTFDKMKLALLKPVIWYGDKWPQEYKFPQKQV